MNKKGFSLIELLAIISVLGVVIIFAFPTMMKSFNGTKDLIKGLDSKAIEEAALMYLKDLESGIVEFKCPKVEGKNDNKCEIPDGTTYNQGDVIKGYDLRLYLGNNKVTVLMSDLVNGGYYEKDCHIDKTTNEKKCDVPMECKVDIQLTLKPYTGIDKTYFLVDDYIAEVDKSSCAIK